MPAAARKLEPGSTTYSVRIEPRYVAVLEQFAREDGTSVESLIEAWVENSCLELNMGKEIELSAEEETELAEAIAEGRAQLARGEGIPHEVAMARLAAKYGG